MRLRSGTSGFSYKEWKGSFYPEDLPAREMLHFYASQLSAVEINNTFYRMPRESMLAGWAEQVPDSFRFSIKASRRITHFKRLKDAGDETGYLLRSVAALGEKLGVLLFQLPPQLPADPSRLEAFLELLPPGTRAAFEFRHPSWQDDAVHALLRARNCAQVAVDAEDSGEDPIVATADWGYLRLRRPGYERAELASWAARVAATGWQEAFVFFKHEDAGAAPQLAASFDELVRRADERRPSRPAASRPPRREAG